MATSRQHRPPKSLAEEINSATRLVHAKLNHLVIDRLALALPPHASSPQLYLSGLASFADVYRKFESLWWSIIRPSSNDIHPGHTRSTTSRFSDPHHDACEPRVRGILAQLYLPGLLRTESLDADLSHGAAPSLDEKSSQSRPQLQAFIAHMEESVVQKPHVLIAYAWVLYMALFSGGRWIRAQLLNAGADFWAEREEAGLLPGSRRSEAKGPGHGNGLSLFDFRRSPEDGEDIKRDFKSRLMGAETALTADERTDVVLESRQIFRFCILLVEELDSIHEASSASARSHRDDLPGVSGAKQADYLMSWRGQQDLHPGWKNQSQPSWRGLFVHPVFNFHAAHGSAIFALLLGLFLWLRCYPEIFPLAA